MSRQYEEVETDGLQRALVATREHLEALSRARAAGDDRRASVALDRALHCLDDAARELSALRLRCAEPPRADEAVVQALPPLLTERETEVLRLLATGMHNREIAAALSVAESTVNTHVDHIMGKLGAVDRVQAAVWAARQGLVRIDE